MPPPPPYHPCHSTPFTLSTPSSFFQLLQHFKTIYFRSPLLGVCILRTTTDWGCESTVLRRSIESRGIQCIQCVLWGKFPLFCCAGNWKSKNKYGGGRFVAEDIHFQFSQWLWLWYFTENTSENETKIYTLKLPVIIIIRPRKQCKAWSLQEFDDVKADQLDPVVIP